MPSYVDQFAGFTGQVSSERRFQQRRGQIIDAAVRLFSEQGYHQATMQAIASEAGVSAGTIYQYVRNKETLLLLAILSVLDSYAVELPLAVRSIEGSLERYCAAFRAYCKVVDKLRDATLLAYRATKSLPPEQREFIKKAERDSNSLVAGYIQNCMAEGLFRPVDVELATYQVVMWAHAWALKHWQFKKRFDLETYMQQGLDLLLNSVLTDKGRAYRQRHGPL